VRGRAESGDRDVAHQDPVAGEKNDDGDDFAGGVAAPHIEESRTEITERDALQHSVDTERGEREVREAVDHQAECEKDEGAAQDAADQGGFGVSALETLREREDDGGADHEEEAGENEVGGRPAVPRGVAEGVVGGGAVVVDHDHEGDGDAAGEVEREDARRRGGGWSGLRGCGHAAVPPFSSSRFCIAW